MDERSPQFCIGLEFIRHYADSLRVRTIVDIHTTRNHAGEIVKIAYVTEHDFCGQTVRESDVPEATIARSEKLKQ